MVSWCEKSGGLVDGMRLRWVQRWSEMGNKSEVRVGYSLKLFYLPFEGYSSSNQTIFPRTSLWWISHQQSQMPNRKLSWTSTVKRKSWAHINFVCLCCWDQLTVLQIILRHETIRNHISIFIKCCSCVIIRRYQCTICNRRLVTLVLPSCQNPHQWIYQSVLPWQIKSIQDNRSAMSTSWLSKVSAVISLIKIENLDGLNKKVHPSSPSLTKTHIFHDKI